MKVHTIKKSFYFCGLTSPFEGNIAALEELDIAPEELTTTKESSIFDIEGDVSSSYQYVF